MSTAHLIHGYIGAGKTTLARTLERELPAIRFTPDEEVARRYGENERSFRYPIRGRRFEPLEPDEIGVDVPTEG